MIAFQASTIISYSFNFSSQLTKMVSKTFDVFRPPYLVAFWLTRISLFLFSHCCWEKERTCRQSQKSSSSQRLRLLQLK